MKQYNGQVREPTNLSKQTRIQTYSKIILSLVIKLPDKLFNEHKVTLTLLQTETNTAFTLLQISIKTTLTLLQTRNIFVIVNKP